MVHGWVNSFAADGLFGQYDMLTKSREMAETLAHGYISESTMHKLSNEHQHDRV